MKILVILCSLVFATVALADERPATEKEKMAYCKALLLYSLSPDGGIPGVLPNMQACRLSKITVWWPEDEESSISGDIPHRVGTAHINFHCSADLKVAKGKIVKDSMDCTF